MDPPVLFVVSKADKTANTTKALFFVVIYILMRYCKAK